MGIYDRDYYRKPARGGFMDFQPWSITTWLIIINVAVFFLDGMLGRMLASSQPVFDEAQQFYGMPVRHPITEWCAFSVTQGIEHLQIWRLITFQFMHADLMHILYNMIGLFMFGPIVESHLGSRRYLAYYLSCGMAGAVLYMIFCVMGILKDGTNTQLIGASAGILGILMGVAKLVPDLTIYIWFPIQVRVLAWLFLGVALYKVITMGVNAGGEAGHLGGAAWGFLLIRNEHWLNFLFPRRPMGKRSRKRVAFRDWSRDMNH